jgi:hypothetical protein
MSSLDKTSHNGVGKNGLDNGKYLVHKNTIFIGIYSLWKSKYFEYL